MATPVPPTRKHTTLVFETPVARTILVSAADATIIGAAIAHRIEELRLEKCGRLSRRLNTAMIDSQIESLAVYALVFNRFSTDIVKQLITELEHGHGK